MTKYFFLLWLLPLISCRTFPDQRGKLENTISFHTDFAGGSLGEVQKIADNHWQCSIAGETDWDGRNRQASWYYFRIEGAKDQSITLDFTKLLGEYNYKPGTHAITSETRPMISYDQKQWTHLANEAVSWDEAETVLQMRLKPLRDTVWVAHQPPYTTSHLQKLIDAFRRHPYLQLQSLGQTAAGSPIPMMTLTNPEVPADQKKTIWIMARQHAWESGTSWVMEGAIQFLLKSPTGMKILDKTIFQLIPMADPEGVARGGVRFNQFGHDLNRNWDLVRPEEMPEIQAQKSAISNWLAAGNKVDFFLTIHNTERADYLQGPDLPIGQKCWFYLGEYTTFRAPEGLRKIPEVPSTDQAGRMTVNEALWREMKVPAYLLELKVEELGLGEGRRSVPEWLELGAGIVRALSVSVE